MTARLSRLVQLLMLGLVLFFAAARPAAAQSLLRDSETELLFKNVSDPLIEAAGLDPRSVKVVLINDPEINAFVAQGQVVYIHSGLLVAADNVNQLRDRPRIWPCRRRSRNPYL
jgi:predicted Zn-dependent protease